MTIPVKWLIGLFVLMFLGAFISSFMGGGDAAVNDLIEASALLGDSFESFNLKSVDNVFYASFDFVMALGGFVGDCIFWNFAFFDGFRWIQMILILINIGILIVILVDMVRMMKPFGG